MGKSADFGLVKAITVPETIRFTATSGEGSLDFQAVFIITINSTSFPVEEDKERGS